MTRQRSRFSGIQSQGPRPNRTWSSLFSTAETSLAGSTKVLVATFVPASGVDETVLRVRGIFSVSRVPLTSAFINGALGLILVTDVAAAAGVASIPGPVSDSGDDGWMVHQFYSAKLELQNATGFDPQMLTQYDIDSKAKRIVQGGSVIAVVIENNGSAAINFSINLRMLSQVRGTR